MKKTPIFAAGIIVGLHMAFTASVFAMTYGFQTTGKDTVVSDVYLNVTDDSACGLYDTYGVSGGIASGVTIDVTKTGTSLEAYGAYFGNSSSGIDGIGSIDGTVRMNTLEVSGQSTYGILFRNAKQAAGAGINGQISVSNTGTESSGHSWIYGIYVFSDSSIGDIGPDAVISVSNTSSLGSACGLSVWESSIGTISGKIIAEGTNSATALSLAGVSGDLHLAGNAHIEANSLKGWGGTAVDRSGSLTVYGDNVGVQTFKGDIGTSYIMGFGSKAVPPGDTGITFAQGRFIFDNHRDKTMIVTADNDSNIIFSAGVRADFVKSVEFITGNLSLEAEFIFHAKTLSDYTNMESQVNNTVYIEDTASFLMMLEGDFTAHEGDYLDLLFGKGTVDGFFGEDNVSVAYDGGLKNLIYGVDFIVEHNPENEAYGRIIFLRDIVVPEPSAYAAAFGFAALLLVLIKRRSK